MRAPAPRAAILRQTIETLRDETPAFNVARPDKRSRKTARKTGNSFHFPRSSIMQLIKFAPCPENGTNGRALSWKCSMGAAMPQRICAIARGGPDDPHNLSVYRVIPARSPVGSHGPLNGSAAQLLGGVPTSWANSCCNAATARKNPVLRPILHCKPLPSNIAPLHSRGGR